MATVNQIKIIVEAEDKASAPIERATKSTRNLGRASREVTRESKKDWGGLADLFGGVLPRNLQMLQRGFKGTQRQVGRLSKSFKILKTAWASIGIGVIIMAVEELVSNWDEWSERLGISTKELKRQEEAQKRVTAQQTATKAELIRYQQTVEDTTALEVDREAALKSLAKTLPQLQGLELDSVEANEKIAQAMADQLAIIDLKDKEAENQKTTEEAITAELEKRVVLTAEEMLGYSALMKGDYKNQQLAMEMQSNILAERRIEVEAELASQTEAALQSQRDTDSEINIIEKRITDQIEAQNKLREDANEAEKELEKTAREAEAARKKAIQDAEADAKWLANQRIQLAQETELRLIEDEEKRDLRSLEMQHEAAKAELALRGGTLTDKLELEQAYLMDKAEIEKGYQDQADEADRDVSEKQAALSDELFALGETDRDREESQAQQLYDRRVALAGDDDGLIKQATQQLVDDLAAIEVRAQEAVDAADKKARLVKIQGMVNMGNAMRGVLGSISDMAEEDSKQQQNLAIVDVLLAQAISVANAIAGATKAGVGTGLAAPVATPIFIAQMVGSVLASFAGVKSILDKAGATGGSVGGGGGGGRGGFAPVTAQVPLPARLDTPDMQAYVVQSQLQGQQNAQGRLHGQIVL